MSASSSFGSPSQDGAPGPGAPDRDGLLLALQRVPARDGAGALRAIVRAGLAGLAAERGSAWSLTAGEAGALARPIVREPARAAGHQVGGPQVEALSSARVVASVEGGARRPVHVLDAGVWRAGAMAGSLRFERRAGPWTEADRAFAAALAERATAALEVVARSEAEAALAAAEARHREELAQRERAEAALRRSEQHFRALIENGSDYIMIVDATSAILYAGPSSERLLGYRPEEMLGQRADDLVHPDDLPLVYERLRWIVEHPGQVATVEFRIRHRDGSWRVYENNGRTLLPDSADAGVVSNGRDITERKAAEAELTRQKAYFEKILDSTDAGVAVFDRDCRFEYASPTAIRDPEMRRWVIGHTNAEYTAKRGLPAELGAQRQDSLEEALRTGRANQFEQESRQPDGSVRYLLRRVVPLTDDAGEIARVIGYSMDITERKQAELALEKAKQEAERANRAKSDFLSRMSHELRTPMNAILGFAQVLERSGLRPEQRKYTGHILKGGRHLLQLINEVLEIARIESGRLSLSCERVPAAAVVREALDLVRPLAEQAHVELEVAPGADAVIDADRQRVVQVLLNLLSNGIKYNRPGGRVRVSCALADGAQDRVVLRVEDTGRGIPRDRLDQLFTPFARLGAEQTDTEGTGLGLALSQRLAETMGGTLSLECTGPEGSVFRLELAGAAGVGAESGPSGDVAPASAVGDAGSTATILYIEDNLTNLSLVETLLETQPGWHAIPALRGKAGLELARERVPDVILLDLHLPDVPGEEVLRQLRGDVRTAEIPVVVISADATPGSIERLRAAGADAYLTKPIELDEFLATVGRYVD